MKAVLSGFGELAVAFSGGVDSSYLLAVAREVNPRVRALIGISPSVSADQREQAHAVARDLGVPLEEVATTELDRPDYRANRGDRCFHCKDTLFETLAARLVDETLLDGTNADDVSGHRPGHRAALAHAVRMPLLECGLGKEAIRRLSRRRGLRTADVPASPCLASRFPAGVPVDEEALRRVEAAEAAVRAAGFSEFRVRHHGDLARLELPRADLPRVVGTETGDALTRSVIAAGYRFVTLDLEGFRSGNGSRAPGDAAGAQE